MCVCVCVCVCECVCVCVCVHVHMCFVRHDENGDFLCLCKVISTDEVNLKTVESQSGITIF